jgi:hypothetical protein
MQLACPSLSLRFVETTLRGTFRIKYDPREQGQADQEFRLKDCLLERAIPGSEARFNCETRITAVTLLETK